MHCNVEFLIVSYIVSMFVDWVFQTNWQASNKSKWGKNDDYRISFLAVTSHSFIYACITTWVLAFFISGLPLYRIFLVLFISHTIIDTRIPVKIIMRWKGLSTEQINDTVNYGFMYIGIDHRLHEATLLILAMFV